MEVSNPFSVEGRTFLVTGASSGIGQSIAIELSKMGATVIGIGRDRQKLLETQGLLENSWNHILITGDLTCSMNQNRIISEIKELGVSLDGVVHAAGISSTVLLKSITMAKIKSHFNINTFGSLLFTKELLNRKVNLLGRGSSIVFISSVMENHGTIGKTIYGMTKGAISAGVKSLSIELAIKNIRVNSVSPSVVETPLSKNSFYRSNSETMSNIVKMHPLGLGEPKDVAYAVIYLLSEASSWITGTSLVVDGGYSSI